MSSTTGSLRNSCKLLPGESSPKMSKPALQKADTEWNTPHRSAVVKPYFGQNQQVRIRAPAASMHRLPMRTVRWSFTTPFISFSDSAWAMIIRCFKPTFRRNRKITNVAADIKPRPPISMSISSTAWPKPLHWLQVSNGVSPVTQVAEVAVNRAFKNAQELPSREAMGSISRPVPTQIMAKKITAINLVALMGLPRRFMFSASTRLYKDKDDSPFRWS